MAGTTADKLAYTESGVADAWAAVGEKGGALSADIALLGDGIRAIPSGGEWTRPVDRPAKPDMQDNTVLMLYGVAELPPNDYALSVETSGSGYTVDWGDGTMDTYTDGEKAEHSYAFNDIGAPINSDGYKMVWITVRPVDGDITLLDTAQVPERFLRRFDTVSEGWYVTQIFEMYVQCPQMSEYRFAEYHNEWFETVDDVEIFYYEDRSASYGFLDIYSLDVNFLERVGALLISCMSLQKIEKMRLDNIIELSDFMGSCVVYNQPFPQETVIPISGDNFMANCINYNQPFPPGIIFESLSQGFLAYSGYNHQLPIENFKLNGDLALPRYNLPLPTIYSVGRVNIYGMSSYSHTLTLDLSEHEAEWLDCNDNPLLRNLVLLNIPEFLAGISLYTNLSLGPATFITIFEALPDRNDADPGQIGIAGCYGAYQLTDDDIMIAVNKNWTVSM